VGIRADLDSLREKQGFVLSCPRVLADPVRGFIVLPAAIGLSGPDRQIFSLKHGSFLPTSTVDTVLVVLLLGALSYHLISRIRSAAEERARDRAILEIEDIADQFETDPEGMSFEEIKELFPLEFLVEIPPELRKMPTGKRSLQRALDITDDENYGNSGGK
jgi:hypothetical protein